MVPTTTVSAVGQCAHRRTPNPEPHLPGVDASPPRAVGGERAAPLDVTPPTSTPSASTPVAVTPPVHASCAAVQASLDDNVDTFRANAQPAQRGVQSPTGHPLLPARNLSVLRFANMTNGLSLADLHELYSHPHYSGFMRELVNLIGRTSDAHPSSDVPPPVPVPSGAAHSSPGSPHCISC